MITASKPKTTFVMVPLESVEEENEGGSGLGMEVRLFKATLAVLIEGAMMCFMRLTPEDIL